MAEEDHRDDREVVAGRPTNEWHFGGALIVAAILMLAVFATFLLPTELQRTASNSGTQPPAQSGSRTP